MLVSFPFFLPFFVFGIARVTRWLARNDNLNNDSRLPRIQLLNNWGRGRGEGGGAGEGEVERALEERASSTTRFPLRPDSHSPILGHFAVER